MGEGCLLCQVVYYESIKREPKIRGIYECRYYCQGVDTFMFYYESRKRELKTKLIYENRCDERLKN